MSKKSNYSNFHTKGDILFEHGSMIAASQSFQLRWKKTLQSAVVILTHLIKKDH